MDQHSAALDRAHQHALDWLSSLQDRPVPPQASIDEVVRALGPDLPENGSDPAEVIDLLARACEPGLTAMPSGRFFGFVIGGTHPAALATDWLVSAWDQNSGLRRLTPAHSAVEDVTSAWLLDLLGLPAGSAVGFVTGGTMANFTGLAAGRDAVLRRAGWDAAERGLNGGPQVRVLVGAERHDTVDLALRYLGLGLPEPVPVDDQGRLRGDALEAALGEGSDGPTIVVLQAGNVHSGAFDPFAEAITVAHAHGAWVHVDGAFGLWAAASPRLLHLVDGHSGADSWATDAHKWLNVPYDCGIALCAHPQVHAAAMEYAAPYLSVADSEAERDPMGFSPEFSRRARALPAWAAIRSLGRTGVAAMVESSCASARAIAEGVAAIPGCEIVNDVVLNQVLVRFETDDRTRAVLAAIQQEGEAYPTQGRWQDRATIRVSVSCWRTDDGDVRRTIAAFERAAAA